MAEAEQFAAAFAAAAGSEFCINAEGLGAVSRLED